MIHANEAYAIAAEENKRLQAEREAQVIEWMKCNEVELAIRQAAEKGEYKVRIGVDDCPSPATFRKMMEANGYKVQSVTECCGIPVV